MREIKVLSQKELSKDVKEKFKTDYIDPLIKLMQKYPSPYREKNPITIFLVDSFDLTHGEEYDENLKTLYFDCKLVSENDKREKDYNFQILLHGTFHAELLEWEEFMNRHERIVDILHLIHPGSNPNPGDFLEEGFSELVSFDEIENGVKNNILDIDIESLREKSKENPEYFQAETFCREIFEKDENMGKFLIDLIKTHVSLDLDGVYNFIEPTMDKKTYKELVAKFSGYHPHPKKGELLGYYEV